MALSSVGAQTLTPRHWGLGQRNAHASREGTCEGRGAKGFILQQVWRDWGGEGERKEASAQDNCTSFHSSWEAHRLLLELGNGGKQMTEQRETIPAPFLKPPPPQA